MSTDGLLRTVGVEEHAWTADLRDALRKQGTDGTVMSISSRPDLDQQLRDLDSGRLEDMSKMGMDFQVLSISTPGTQTLDAAEAVPLARGANDALANAVRAHPGRFGAFATLPTPDPNAAVEELVRSVSELGLIGAMLFPRTGDVYLDHDRFRPIFEAAADLRVPLYIHPQLAPQAVVDACFTGFNDQITLTLAGGAWGWHIDAGLAALRLILAGTFDRHPDLQIVLGHWGEVLVPFLERADALSDRGASYLDRRVAEYVTGNVLVSAGGIYSHRMLQQTIAMTGADRIFFAADYPYQRTPDGGAKGFLEQAPISLEDKKKIAHLNAERLLRVPGLALSGSPDSEQAR